MKNLLDFVPLTIFASLLQIEVQTQVDSILLTSGLFVGLIISCFRLYFMFKSTMNDGKISPDEMSNILQEFQKIGQNISKIQEINKPKHYTSDTETETFKPMTIEDYKEHVDCLRKELQEQHDYVFQLQNEIN